MGSSRESQRGRAFSIRKIESDVTKRNAVSSDSLMTTHTPAASAPATALKPRMDHWSVAPALMQGLVDLQQVADSAGIERSLHFLITLRVSQINGCAFCMNMHSAEAK